MAKLTMRNRLFCVASLDAQKRGLDRLTTSLQIPSNLSPYPPPVLPWAVDTTIYRDTPHPSTHDVRFEAQRVHPYRHHTRAIATTNAYLFLTNVASLPPPDSVIYQPHSQRNLSGWEQALSADGGSQELWAKGRRWAEDWKYLHAVDGSWRTAWRSPDGEQSQPNSNKVVIVIRACMLIRNLDSRRPPSTDLHDYQWSAETTT